MQLNLQTDYALRVLMYLARKGGDLSTIHEIAEYFEISEHHLVKVVHQLGLKGYICTSRGRNGGMVLARPPAAINVGDVIRSMERHFNVVECFNPEFQSCRLLPTCRLKGLLYKAREAFLETVDGSTLGDLVSLPSECYPGTHDSENLLMGRSTRR